MKRKILYNKIKKDCVNGVGKARTRQRGNLNFRLFMEIRSSNLVYISGL